MTSLVSVVIPIRNEVNTIEACIQGILRQSIPVLEIIALDSCSSDGTRDILAKYPAVRVIDIDPADFNHGLTRNVGVIAASRADYVLFTVADARPVDDHWIERLLSGFTDGEVSAVCGQQIVEHSPQTNPVEWFRPVSPPQVTRYQFLDAGQFDRLPSGDKASVCGWDNVTAMYRRDALLKMPFQPVTYAEDMVWASEAVRSGCALVYAKAARVYHFHCESPEFTYRRTLIVSSFRFREFGYIPNVPDSLRNVARAVKLLVRERGLTAGERLGWARYNCLYQIAFAKAVREFRKAAMEGADGVTRVIERAGMVPPIPKKYG